MHRRPLLRREAGGGVSGLMKTGGRYLFGTFFFVTDTIWPL